MQMTRLQESLVWVMEYSYTEEPSWRTTGKKTSELLKDITEYTTRYQSLPESAKQFCEKEFVSAKIVDCIYHINIGELVGTQTLEETKHVLEALLFSNRTHIYSTDKMQRSHLETLNIYFAMRALQDICEEMNHSGLITVQQICDVHRVLMCDLHKDGGNIRTTEVYTTYDNSCHFYPSPAIAEQRLFALVDRHNIRSENFPFNKLSLENISNVFKYAAQLLFEFVDTHPFADGNGRTCRLLANHVISHITPFPVQLYHSDRNGRDDYIEAIVKCRDNPEGGPSDLAAMLIEGAWTGWKSLFLNLERQDQSCC